MRKVLKVFLFAALLSTLTMAASSAPVEKVTICHIPPGNPDNAHTITVGAPAVSAHIQNHGDYIGPCKDDGGGVD